VPKDARTVQRIKIESSLLRNKAKHSIDEIVTGRASKEGNVTAERRKLRRVAYRIALQETRSLVEKVGSKRDHGVCMIAN
jgi:predicted unusual protein kinase regulating ubiquinone biosynthesis (AarF/ABC1/UbiB family)